MNYVEFDAPHVGAVTTWPIAMQRARELSRFWHSRVKVRAVCVRFPDGTEYYLYQALLP